MELSGIKKDIVSAIDGLKDELVSISEYIHANPELGLEEYKASSMLCESLEKHGFQVERGICDMSTAFLGSYSGADQGRKVAILAEYDALEGVGHACGHNMIAAISLGASISLRQVLSNIPGTVVIFGTPAEEGNVDGAGGKAPMADNGYFDDCAAALMIHPSVRTGAGGGPSLGAASLEIKFKGSPSHAASSPHLGVNALNGLIETFNGINALRQHITQDARIHGIITHGGTAPNVVPERAVGRFLIRATEMNNMMEIMEKVKNCAKGAALMSGAEVEFKNYNHIFEPPLRNNTLAKAFRENYRAIGLDVPEPKFYPVIMASTDFGNVSQRTPSTMGSIAMAPMDTIGHSHEMAEAANSLRARDAIIEAAKGLALTALDVLTDDELVEEARKEFEDLLK